MNADVIIRSLGIPEMDKDHEQWRFATKGRGGRAQISENLSIALVPMSLLLVPFPFMLDPTVRLVGVAFALLN